MRYMRCVAVVIAVCFSLLAFQTAAVAASATVQLRDGRLTVRATPSAQGAIVGYLNNGSVIEADAAENGWSRITYQGKSAYVSAQYLKMAASQPAPVSSTGVLGSATVTASALILRATPSTSGGRLGTIPNGGVVTLLEKSGDWYKVVYQSITGYCLGTYLSLTLNTAGPLSGKTIFVDAGHGGTEKGTIAAEALGYLEKDLNLAVALELKPLLEAAGATVIMTRTNDSDVDLYDRAALVNKWVLEKERAKTTDTARLSKINTALTLLNQALSTQSGKGVPAIFSKSSGTIHPSLAFAFEVSKSYQNQVMFISIHHNDTEDGNPTRQGTEIYYTLDNPSASYSGYSGYAAEQRIVLSQLMLGTVSEQVGLSARGAFSASFAVTREQNVPSCLVEIGFLNHPIDRMTLLQPSLPKNAAQGIFNGISQYYEIFP